MTSSDAKGQRSDAEIRAEMQAVMDQHPDGFASGEALVSAAIEAYQRGVGVSAKDPAVMAVFLNNFGLRLLDEHRKGGERTPLDGAIDAHRRALSVAPSGWPQLPGLLFNLGLSLQTRFLVAGSPADLDAAIDAYSRALADAPDLLAVQCNLGNRLENRYRLTGSITDLNRAIDLLRSAVEASATESPQLPGRLSDLGVAVLTRYEFVGAVDDLDASIRAVRRALGIAPADSPDRHKFLSNLGLALESRYDRGGAVRDLDDAIQAHQAAVDAAPAVDTLEILNNLGRGLRRRYERIGELSALDAAIDALQRAADAAPRDWPALPTLLHNLGVGLARRFESRRLPRDLDVAIDALQRAVDLLPRDAVVLPAFLSDLGTWLRVRSEHYGPPGDLEEAIEALERASEATRPESSDVPAVFSNLGRSLLDRYQRTGAVSDLDASIDALRVAAEGASPQSPGRPILLSTLGDGLRERYEHRGVIGDRDGAINAYRAGCLLGLEILPDATLGAAISWGLWATKRESWKEAVEAYGFGVDAVAALHRAQVMRADKHVWMRAAKNLAAARSYAHAKLGQLQDAVLDLEQGRALLLSEALGRDRAELEILRQRGRGDLRERYQQATDGLRGLERAELDAAKTLSTETPIHHLRAARSQLDAVIEEIRAVHDFEDFLRPPTFHHVARAAAETRLVYLVAAPSGGLALIVGTEGLVAQVSLPELTYGGLRKRAATYLSVYESSKNPTAPYASPGDASPDDALKDEIKASWKAAYAEMYQARWREALDDLTAWLWVAAMEPLLQQSAGLDQLVLIPVGLLGTLPLHAAWTDDRATPTGRRFALDVAELTYAPNARTLDACRRAARRITGESLLAIGDTASLVYAGAELDAATRSFEVSTTLEGEHATVDAVSAALPRHSVLHFACHGFADLDEPLSSALELPAGGRLTLRDVMGQRLDYARLAVLSACETALPGAELPDEVIGLPSGFMEAGATGVIASLWNVPDLPTMMLMTRFYEHWQPGRDRPAAALRQAQQWVRDTTNAEKAHLFPALADLAQQFIPPENRADWDEARDQQGLDHWAAFAYVGG